MKNYSVIGLCLCVIISLNYSAAQTPVNTFNTVSNIVVSGGTSTQTIRSHGNSVNGVLANTNYSVKYNNTGNVSIVDFTISSKTYVQFDKFDTIIIRRVANTWIPSAGNKQHIYCQGNAVIDNLTFNMPFPVAYPVVSNHAYMERVMKDGYINRGSDNVFTNDSTSDLTHNNIERVDFVFLAGMATTAPSSAGFLIAERGGNDAFKIAAIKSIDANGNPTSFGNVVSVSTAFYGAALLSAATYVMRKDVADNALRPFSLVPLQSIRSVFIRFSDLGITSMQNVYGYALMGSDVTATTSAQVLAYTNNTYFPTNTGAGTGGMDLASAPGIYHTDLVLESKFINASTYKKNGEQVIQWSDDDFQQVKEYQLERSFDRVSFETIATVGAEVSAIASYSYTDRSFNTSSYYRVKAISNEGSSYYSSILFAKYDQSGGVTIYPNPAVDKLAINFDGDTRPNRISLFSADGKECGQWIVANNTQAIQLDIRALPRGQYFVKLMNEDGWQKAYPVMKQ
ncbi:MAG: T9SS type A sorting domain-containing protein [Chitinophagaceae bacterium]|nr:T9SS type A sorting domain-containing protein [Chitinophagaceae bacterium]